MALTAQSRGLPGFLAALFFLTLSVLALKEMRLSTTASAVSAPLEGVVNSLTFSHTKYRLREKYTGIEPLDLGLRYLVAAFLPGVAGWDKGFQIQQIYFLVSFFPIIAIMSVEAGRKRSDGSWTSLYDFFQVCFWFSCRRFADSCLNTVLPSGHCSIRLLVAQLSFPFTIWHICGNPLTRTIGRLHRGTYQPHMLKRFCRHCLSVTSSRPL